ncbi:MAG: transketolase [Candidatus Levybacteria bacterium CG_4_10_14_0_8_um_filter_35_23]|nr:MAG: transketolase [Candidatus Levybacteria bacterium CG_4_10_14_0_8_um_filter_35_23]
MLNPDLKLNPKIFDNDVEKKATRDGFGEALFKLGKSNEKVVVLSADLSKSTKANKFAEAFPNRYIECGVAEQNMIAVAAGLAVSGKIPFASSYAVFSPGKNWETVRTTVVYNNTNVKIAGHHAGIVTGPDGATHQATEDIAILRALPGIKIFCPCDALEAEKVTLKSAKINGPIYLRFSRQNSPFITTTETPFEEGKIYTYWGSENPKTTIFATGHMLYQALLAAMELEKENINVLVANVSTIKPLDEKTVVELARRTGTIVTCEDHQVAGGMGSAIAESLARSSPTPMEFIGLKDTFAQSGQADELIEKYGLDKNSIKEAVRKVLKRAR